MHAIAAIEMQVFHARGARYLGMRWTVRVARSDDASEPTRGRRPVQAGVTTPVCRGSGFEPPA